MFKTYRPCTSGHLCMEEYVLLCFLARARGANPNGILIGRDRSIESQRVYWFADFTLTAVMQSYHASRHRAFLEGAKMEGCRIYFQIPPQTVSRMKQTNYSNYLPTNGEYAFESGYFIMSPGVVKLSVEVGEAGTYLLYDQYKSPRKVMQARMGNSRGRPNRYGAE